LLRALQPQHQLDQLFAAQPLKIASAHPTNESAKSRPRKGVGNYRGLPLQQAEARCPKGCGPKISAKILGENICHGAISVKLH
ncbi:hypothetical protein ACFQ12_12455, partial [Methylobacterium trifolii]